MRERKINPEKVPGERKLVIRKHEIKTYGICLTGLVTNNTGLLHYAVMNNIRDRAIEIVNHQLIYA